MQLLLGLDNVGYMPMELDRHADEGGQLILYRSCILGLVLPSGSRRTGHESSLRYESGQRIYRIIEDGSIVSLNRLETQAQNPHHLYNDKEENDSEEIVTDMFKGRALWADRRRHPPSIGINDGN